MNAKPTNDLAARVAAYTDKVDKIAQDAAEVAQAASNPTLAGVSLTGKLKDAFSRMGSAAEDLHGLVHAAAENGGFSRTNTQLIQTAMQGHQKALTALSAATSAVHTQSGNDSVRRAIASIH